MSASGWLRSVTHCAQRLGQSIRVNRAVLERDDAEEQVALGIHGSLTIGSDRVKYHQTRAPIAVYDPIRDL